MTIPELDPKLVALSQVEERKRRMLLALLLVLLLVLCVVGYLFFNYLLKPQPIVDMLPAPAQVNYPPTYKSYFPTDKSLSKPVGVAVSPDGQLVYVSESDGERLIKMFDRDGNFIKSFAPPGTSKTNRSPAYIAVDPAGRVFVTDSYNNVVVIFDKDGNFLDGIIDKDTTLTRYLSAKLGKPVPPGSLFYYNNISSQVDYKLPGQNSASVPGPDRSDWAPLGLRFDRNGNLMVTNTAGGKQEIIVYPAADVQISDWSQFNPVYKEFGTEGKEAGQFFFPNSVVTDSSGTFYVSDGNNGRISAWSVDMRYTNFFAFGSTEDSLNLPRGEWMDEKDRLHVADAVGQYIRIYDVSTAEPKFLFNVGVFGDLEGQFNFPVDICIDAGGRIYIADRDNNRIDIWSY